MQRFINSTLSPPISIHAPREGGDSYIRTDFLYSLYFNPRPPRGGRLRYGSSSSVCKDISIHAPREGGDSKDAQFYLRIFDK